MRQEEAPHNPRALRPKKEPSSTTRKSAQSHVQLEQQLTPNRERSSDSSVTYVMACRRFLLSMFHTFVLQLSVCLAVY